MRFGERVRGVDSSWRKEEVKPVFAQRRRIAEGYVARKISSLHIVCTKIGTGLRRKSGA